MTVSELIQELQKLPGDADVGWSATEDDCWLVIYPDEFDDVCVELSLS